jgi:hypothetical protein
MLVIRESTACRRDLRQLASEGPTFPRPKNHWATRGGESSSNQGIGIILWQGSGEDFAIARFSGIVVAGTAPRHCSGQVTPSPYKPA